MLLRYSLIIIKQTWRYFFPEFANSTPNLPTTPLQLGTREYISNVKYLTFNFCDFCIQSFCSQIGNVGYFVFSLAFVLRAGVFCKSVTLGMLFSISAFFFVISLNHPTSVGSLLANIVNFVLKNLLVGIILSLSD